MGEEFRQRLATDHSEKQWIGVDLDGTLCHFDPEEWLKDPDYIGRPIPSMLDKVRRWRAEGYEVRLFTARAAYPDRIRAIRKYLTSLDLGDMIITNRKDYGCIALFDDIAYRVGHNTGVVLT